MMERFCESSERLKAVNYFCQSVSSQIFDRVLNTPLEFEYGLVQKMVYLQVIVKHQSDFRWLYKASIDVRGVFRTLSNTYNGAFFVKIVNVKRCELFLLKSSIIDIFSRDIRLWLYEIILNILRWCSKQSRFFQAQKSRLVICFSAQACLPIRYTTSFQHL